MKATTPKRILSLVLALALCLGLYVPAGASQPQYFSDGEFLQGEIPAQSFTEEELTIDNDDTYSDTDRVRVSIVLEGTPALYTASDSAAFTEDTRAVAYREGLREMQDGAAEEISDTIGEELDVVWNLTLAANIISANMDYGDIEAVEDIDGIVEVVIEEEYEPCVVDRDETTDPNMATSGAMIGSSVAWADGYTGAGSKVAIIDTGLDTDHQSFNADAFEYAIDEVTDSGKTVSLLSEDDVENALTHLNAYDGYKGTLTAGDLYNTAKIPFGYNYVDNNLTIDHLSDTQGEHGSHVAGIAAANRYIKTGEDTYQKALDMESVRTQGVAPDAQIFVMKVFGQGGGAYDSDYMAAIEDAIVLGADSVNLSLGSSYGGESTNTTYQALLESLESQGAVVSISAGNEYTWQEETATGELYADDVNMQTDGLPGSYTNALTVAAVENIGSTGNVLRFDGVADDIVFTDHEGEGLPAFVSLDTSNDGNGTELDYIYLGNVGVTVDKDDNITHDYFAENKAQISGKVVLVNRGESTFVQKHEAAAKAGAVGLIVVNTEDALMNMSLDDSKAKIPAALIAKSSGDKIKNAATTSGSGIYTGKITIKNSVTVKEGDTKNGYTMCDFSSWGVPGSLELKPEISAPGGNIYSVFGTNKLNSTTTLGGTDRYENMSGTSMAAPQIAGMAALLAQHWREQGKTHAQQRALSQSLLMSTAEPMKDKNGNYYSLLNQGAGLANVGNALSAHSYILMDKDANAGAEDGKVKVELGDDPEKSGLYSFRYTIYNIENAEATYDLSTDVFTQAIKIDNKIEYLSTDTVKLTNAHITYTVDGSEVTTVTVPANGSKTVTVKINVGDYAELENYENGAYIQAYSFAKEQTTTEGAKGTEHSIPVLGFYGNWTDASMYDVGTLVEYLYGTETRESYLSESTNYYTNYLTVLSGNSESEVISYPTSADDKFIADRTAMNSTTDILYKFYYTPIRNAAAAKLVVTDTDDPTKVYYDSGDLGEILGAYYNYSTSKWRNVDHSVLLGWDGTDQNGKKLPEDTSVTASLILAPEYYVDYDFTGSEVKKTVRWEELGEGAYLSTQVAIDNTAPVLDSFTYDESKNTLTLNVQDNRYLAKAMVYYLNSDDEIKSWGGKTPQQQEADKGKKIDVKFSLAESSTPLTKGTDILIELTDYANNVSTYKLTLGEDSTPVTPTEMEISGESLTLYKNNSQQLSLSFKPWLADETATWTSSNSAVAAVDSTGKVTALSEGTAVITAKSTKNSALTATCTVTVKAANVTINAALQDTDGNPQLVKWNMKTDKSWTKTADLDYSMTAAASGLDCATEEEVVYQIDSYGYLNTIDPATGEILYETDFDAAAAPMDIAYAKFVSRSLNEDMLIGVYGQYLLFDNSAYEYDGFYSGWDLSDELEKGEYLVAIADYTSENTSDYFWCLTTECRLLPVRVSMKISGLTLGVGSPEPLNMGEIGELPFVLESNGFCCSMASDDDLNLYLSHYNGTTNDIYLIQPDDDNEFCATLLGNVGYDVWPCALLSIAENKTSSNSGGVVEEEPPTAPIDEIFNDVSENDWYAEAVRYAYENGLMVGVADKTFDPASELTRSMFVAILFNYGGEETADPHGYGDVPANAWYAQAVAWATAEGIVSGHGGGRFAPDEPITREQVVTILYQYAKSLGLSTTAPETALAPYPDSDSVSGWAQEALRWAVHHGVMSGSDGKLKPQGTATRAEVAALMKNFCEKFNLM